MAANHGRLEVGMHNSPASTDDAIVEGRSRPRSVSRRTAVLYGPSDPGSRTCRE
jgi:hypothetical protein